MQGSLSKEAYPAAEVSWCVMDELLYLVHRIPYPPNKGDKIRSYHLLQHLAQFYTIHVGAFVDTEEDWQHADTLSKLVGGEVKLLPLDTRWATLKSTYGLLSGEPLTFPYYRDSRMQRWVDQLLARRAVTRSLAYSSGMAQYLMRHQHLRRVIDFVDIDSDKWCQYADQRTGIMRWVFQRESRRLFKMERRIAQTFDASTFVSEAEANLFKRLAPDCANKVFSFSNGVDADVFSPTHSFASPYAANEVALVFTGAMDYWPNADAVTWFANEVWPAVLRARPSSRFYIVGSRPTPAVLALGKLSGVVVTGMVPDIRPYIAHAALSVAPLRVARGIQNKVLEAMSMAKIVIASPQALEGIGAQPGKEMLLANDVETWVRQINDALTGQHAAMGISARERVLSDFSWPAHLSIIERLLDKGRENTSIALNAPANVA